MRYSILAASALAILPSIVAGAPSVLRRQAFVPPTNQEISDAQNQWAADTSRVSLFLTGATQLSGQALADAASNALDAENDETLHKQILDDQFLTFQPDSNVQNANNVLVDQGHFNEVVKALGNLKDNGANMSPDDVAQAIDDINNNRCNNVLPAIDTYFQAAGNLLQNGVTLVANRPQQCMT